MKIAFVVVAATRADRVPGRGLGAHGTVIGEVAVAFHPGVTQAVDSIE